MATAEPLSTTAYKTEFVSADLAAAIKEARKRKVMSKPEFYALDFQNKLTSWTVSGDLDLKAIQSIQNAANSAIKAGLTYKDFASAITPDTLSKITAPRVVWRNAVSFAYQRGRYEQQARVKAIRPYLQYVTFGDERVRPNHRAMNGIVAPFDDPFWKANYPPNGHNCRCTAKSLTERQVKRDGLKVQTNAEIQKEVVDAQIKAGVPASEVVKPEADPGWKGSFAQSPNLGTYQQIKAFGKLPDPNTFISFVTPKPLEIIKTAVEPVVAGTLAASEPASAVGVKIVNEGKEQKFEDFVQVGSQLGSNPGGQFTDAAGQKWYIKYTDEDHAANEITANKLYNLAGVETPEVIYVRKDGKRTVASKWIEGLEKNGKVLTGGKVEGVAEGFGSDVWLANWDVAGAGFDNLQIAGGKAIRVDAGGALKYRAQGAPKGDAFGNIPGELQTFFDTGKNPNLAAILKNYSWEDLLPSVTKVAEIKKGDIRKIVNAYMNGTSAEKKALYEKLIARQEALKEFAFKKAEELKAAGKTVNIKIATPKSVKEAKKAEALKKKVEAEAAKKAALQAEADAAAAAKEAEKAAVSESYMNTPEGKRFERGSAKITKQDAADIERTKSIGYSIPSDGDAIEDQQIQFFEKKDADGNLKTTAIFKLREDHFNRFTKKFKIGRDIQSGFDAEKISSLKGEVDQAFIDAIISVKNKINKAVVVPEVTAQKAATAVQKFNELQKQLIELEQKGVITQAERFAFNEPYLKPIRELQDIKAGVTPVYTVEGTFSGSPLPTFRDITATGDEKIIFRPQKNVVYENNIVNGFDTETNKQSFTLGTYQRAKIGQASIKTYTDFEANPTLFGRIEIEVPGGASEAGKKIFKALDQLEINTTAPKVADAEELYLRQIAAKMNDPKLLDFMDSADHSTEDQAVRIKQLKNALNVKFRAENGIVDFDIEKLPDYNPIGVREGLNDTGRLIRKIPVACHASPAEWEKFRREYYMIQNPWNDEDGFGDTIERILNSGGKLISNYTKTRRGISIEKGTASANSDMKVGGGQSVFTRIRDMGKYKEFRTGFVWDADRLRRLDAITYQGDAYGKTIDGYIRRNRKFGVNEYKQIGRDHAANETNFKDELDIFQDLKFIVAKNDAQRAQIIKAMKKNGVSALPDGRKIEDVVTIQGGAIRPKMEELNKNIKAEK